MSQIVQFVPDVDICTGLFHRTRYRRKMNEIKGRQDKVHILDGVFVPMPALPIAGAFDLAENADHLYQLTHQPSTADFFVPLAATCCRLDGNRYE